MCFRSLKETSKKRNRHPQNQSNLPSNSAKDLKLLITLTWNFNLKPNLKKSSKLKKLIKAKWLRATSRRNLLSSSSSNLLLPTKNNLSANKKFVLKAKKVPDPFPNKISCNLSSQKSQRPSTRIQANSNCLTPKTKNLWILNRKGIVYNTQLINRIKVKQHQKFLKLHQ